MLFLMYGAKTLDCPSGIIALLIANLLGFELYFICGIPWAKRATILLWSELVTCWFFCLFGISLYIAEPCSYWNY